MAKKDRLLRGGQKSIQEELVLIKPNDVGNYKPQRKSEGSSDASQNKVRHAVTADIDRKSKQTRRSNRVGNDLERTDEKTG
jgi:hypothetical protein